jgi:hypothetical protein
VGANLETIVTADPEMAIPATTEAPITANNEMAFVATPERAFSEDHCAATPKTTEIASTQAAPTDVIDAALSQIPVGSQQVHTAFDPADDADDLNMISERVVLPDLCGSPRPSDLPLTLSSGLQDSLNTRNVVDYVSLPLATSSNSPDSPSVEMEDASNVEQEYDAPMDVGGGIVCFILFD